MALWDFEKWSIQEVLLSKFHVFALVVSAGALPFYCPALHTGLLVAVESMWIETTRNVIYSHKNWNLTCHKKTGDGN